jgi:small subunit ribosomal protein S1
LTDDQINDDNTNDEPSFAELFESYSMNSADIQTGDRISGKIISIGSDDVFVNTGTKTDGAVAKRELADDQGNFNYRVGDTLDLYVVTINDSEIRLSKSISGADGNALMLRDAYEKKIPVAGKVTEECKGGFRVDIMKKIAFCPISQIDHKYAESPDAYVGSTFDFLITKFEDKGKNLVVSRREILKRQFAAAREKFFNKTNIGDILDGKITKIMPFGAFVELEPGIEGMIHISELSWSRTNHPDEVVQRDQIVKVKILGIEPDPKKPENTKISVSIKHAQDDPWISVPMRFKAGDKVSGKVSRLADFGAFVEIAPGVDGLVHISEMSYAKRILRSEDVVSVGETVSVMIKEIDPLKKRISLSIKDAEGDPWLDIEKKYTPGKVFHGVIEKKEPFGFFVNLEPGVTGLLPKSKIENTDSAFNMEKLKVNDTIGVMVDAINVRDRKISLSIGDASDKDEWKKFTPGQSAADSSLLGALGEKLQAALKSKK